MFLNITTRLVIENVYLGCDTNFPCYVISFLEFKCVSSGRVHRLIDDNYKDLVGYETNHYIYNCHDPQMCGLLENLNMTSFINLK